LGGTARYFFLPGKRAGCYEFSAGAVAAGSVAAAYTGLPEIELKRDFRL
jgi:hypothetical protein